MVEKEEEKGGGLPAISLNLTTLTVQFWEVVVTQQHHQRERFECFEISVHL